MVIGVMHTLTVLLLDVTCVARGAAACGRLRYLYLGSKTAYAALLGHCVAQLRPHVPPLEPHVPQLGRPELPKGLPESMFDRFWNGKTSKSAIPSSNFEVFTISQGLTKQRSKRLQKVTPSGPGGCPRGPQERPGRPPERPKSRQERPPPGCHVGPSLGRYSTLRGAIFTHFSTFRTAFANLSFALSLCKHTVSIARRPCVTSAC